MGNVDAQRETSVVIVGGGQGGFEVASNLRSRGWDGSITVVSAEPGTPYQRPPLSKAYLKPSAEHDLDDIILRPVEWYQRSGITLECGVRVETIDRSKREVLLADGRRLPFDYLVLATGARNRELPVEGSDLVGVHYLRTLDDADGLVAAMRRATSVAVVGAGFIGLEVAAAAARCSLRVTVFEATDRPMSRAVSRPISEHFAALHDSNGVIIRTRTGVTRLVGSEGRVTGVQTADGEVVAADLVVVGIGVVPEDGLASDTGLAVRNGIVVDERLRTTDPRVFAIGDCASFPAGDRHVRLESVQNAVDQARCVAAQIAGAADGYHAVPWFWTEQYESKLQMAGLVDGHQQVVVRGAPESGSFSVFCFSEEGELLGVESVNQPRDHMAARRLLAAGVSLTPSAAADPNTDLKALSRA